MPALSSRGGQFQGVSHGTRDPVTPHTLSPKVSADRGVEKKRTATMRTAEAVDAPNDDDQKK